MEDTKDNNLPLKLPINYEKPTHHPLNTFPFFT